MNLGKRVIHLYVDPVYGEDDRGLSINSDCAEQLNPGPNLASPPCGLTPNWPTEVIDAGKPLLHAPFPFRTITRAIATIPALPKNTSWTNTSTNTTYNVTWSHAIVHLLPGMYRRGQPYDEQSQVQPELYDWANGMRHNREFFPIQVPRRVSIQGTNALNTFIELYDAGADTGTNRPGPAFEFGTMATSADSQTVPCDGEGSYIDAVTIHGAIANPPSANYPAPRENAGIYIGDGMASAPTISNCVFFGNMVGISVAASIDPVTQIRHHGTRIINNTFASNVVGVWNGQAGSGYGPNTEAIGLSELILVNNVFQPYVNGLGYDPTMSNGGCDYGRQLVPPTGTPGQPLWQHWRSSLPALLLETAFEGVHYDDLNTAIGGGQYRDFNAYEVDTTNVPNANSGNRPGFAGVGLTLLRSTTPPSQTLSPSVNLAPITGWTSAVPPPPTDVAFGILFVRDLFCNGVAHARVPSPTPQLPAEFIAPAATGPFFDGSPHDFRLAPVSTLSGLWNNPSPGVRIPNLGANTFLNPLVDAGYWGTTITQKNGRTVPLPGQLLDSSDPDYNTFPYHTWVFDLEGHGNPRVHDHPLYPNTNSVGLPIDIGADEMGELIIAGYRYGTTSFLYAKSTAVLPVNQPSGLRPMSMDNRYMWYIGPPTVSPSTFTVASIEPPQARLVDWPTRQGNCATVPVTLGWLHHPLYYSAAQSSPPAVPWYSPPSVAGLGSPNCSPNGGLVFQPWRFSTKTTPTTCAGYYFPTFADVTPHLLPDVHPWWQVAWQTIPTNPFWGNCMSNPPYNGLLYVDPWTNRTNPPGSYLGGSITVPGSPSSTLEHQWLDYSSFAGQPSLTASKFVSLHNLSWTSTPSTHLSIDGFTTWCVGQTNQPSRLITIFQETEDERATGAELLGVRLSLEQGFDANSQTRRGGTWSGAKDTSNLQSFLLFVEKQ